MGELLAIDPHLHFPLLTTFNSGDQFNGARGTWFYRDQNGYLKGPFKSRTTATLDMATNCGGAIIAMRTPFESDGVWWWKQDGIARTHIRGPYLNAKAAQAAIDAYTNSLKEKAQ